MNCQDRVVGWLRGIFACTMLGCSVGSSTASAGVVEPLRSAQLDARLTEIGFDKGQREQALAQFEAYVQNYSGPVAQRLSEWQGATAPQTIEEARAIVSKGRAACQAIEEAERPLLDAIRTAAKAEQAAAVANLLIQLEIRRDLALCSTGIGFGDSTTLNIDQVIEPLKLSPQTIALMKPVLDQYWMERQTAVRRLRDASINMPLKKFEAAQQHPEPPPPTVDPGDNAQLNAKDFFASHLAAQRARAEAARAERIAAIVKVRELDIRTIDALLPLLGGVQQARLVSSWWDGLNSMFGVGALELPSQLRHAWAENPKRAADGVIEKCDPICANWVALWWPVGKDQAIASAGKDMFELAWSQDNNLESSVKRDPKVEAVNAATTKAKEEIDLLVLGPEEVAKRKAAHEQLAKDHGAQVANGAIAFVAAGSEGVIELGALPVGDGSVEFEGVAMVQFGDDGPVFELSGLDGNPVDTGLLPKMIRFEEIKPVLAAAGVEEGMMGVAKTAIDDLIADAHAIVKSAEELQAAQNGSLGGAFDVGPDGAFKPADPKARKQRAQQRDELRQQLLALESSRLDELLTAVVPASGEATVAWLKPWRKFESERASAHSCDNVQFGERVNDPIAAAFSANFTAADWKAAAPSLRAVCDDLQAKTRAKCDAAHRTMEEMPVFSGFGGASVEAPDEKAIERFHQLVEANQRAGKVLESSIADSIKRIKECLAPEAAIGLQDAWDEQLFASDLKDSTNLAGRFDAVTAMALPESVRAQATAMFDAWKTASREIRTRIVAIKSQLTVTPRTFEEQKEASANRKARAAELAAVKFERDELNRRVFRELCALIGSEHAARLAPLPEAKKPTRMIEAIGLPGS